ncbi:STAS domain-containing protein [Streptacidiphilus anmyonensis]|uniref:STAS domain-containing protein n=1 Tax=Streptacidiphilus anmyonensis TaxID=405782 RepID=UPI000694FC76|nr:STAS domain-containing protein [Streptacidiphilus anmyonensis]
MTQVTYGERHGWTIAQLEGELDLQAVAAVRERLATVIWSGSRRLVVDLSRLSFCDSLGFGALVATRRQMASAGGQLRLVLPAEDSVARKALTACGIERIFDVFEATADAVAPEGASVTHQRSDPTQQTPVRTRSQDSAS